MAKGFYLHKVNGIWILNNPFLKSEKGLYKIVFGIKFSNNPWARKAL
jgi:hypothetical protein